MRATVKRLSKQIAFDGVVFPSISLLYGRSSELLPPSTQRIHVMWDFFPTHHKQVGSLPSIPGIERPLKLLERWSMGLPDTVLSMSEVGRDFFEEYHPGVAKAFSIQAPWSSDVPDRVKLAQGGRFRVVFGGQLARGRGVDNLIRAAAHLLTVGKMDLAIDFLIAGSGPEEQTLRDLVLSVGATNVTFTGQMSRSAYRDLLLSSHVGVAITDRRVDSPSFPSKIGDYARVGLPIIVATEASSDVGEFVESRGAGLAADPASPESLAEAILQLHEMHRIGDLTRTSHNSRRLFEEHMSASVAASTVLRSIRP